MANKNLKTTICIRKINRTKYGKARNKVRLCKFNSMVYPNIRKT